MGKPFATAARLFYLAVDSEELPRAGHLTPRSHEGERAAAAAAGKRTVARWVIHSHVAPERFEQALRAALDQTLREGAGASWIELVPVQGNTDAAAPPRGSLW